MPRLPQTSQFDSNAPFPRDDQPLTYIRRDLSAGQNSRLHGSNIPENQATVLYNADLSVPGQTIKRPGETLVDTLSSYAQALFGFIPQGGTNQLIAINGTNLSTWPATGSFTNRKSNFTSTTRPILIKGGKASGTALGTFTVTIASPGVFTKTAHGLAVGDEVYFTTTGALPTGLTASTKYYVVAGGFTVDAFEVSATSGGTAITTSGSQSGTHSLYRFSAFSSGDILFIGNGTDNWFQMNQDYTFADLRNTNLSPPIGNVGYYYRSRLWVLKQNKLYWSDAFAGDYSVAFDRTTNQFNMPVGAEQAIIAIRDLGLICFGQDRVYTINPSTVPAATDKAELIYDKGCVAGNSVCQVGDDIYFLSSDGVRSLQRTQQDKVQIGASYPLSYNLKTEFEALSWNYINNSCAAYFDNKYFISVPSNASTTNNQVWVYYPATQGWMVLTGWNVSAWSKLTVNGQEKLYATDAITGNVYQAWTGFSDNGTAINYQEESRKDDMGQPLVTKYSGYLKIKALAVGNYNLTVSASPDDQGYIVLGTMNLLANQPSLPIDLSFALADTSIVEQSFPLDDLGPWKLLRVKIQHNALNGSDNITILERNLLTYADEYVP